VPPRDLPGFPSQRRIRSGSSLMQSLVMVSRIDAFSKHATLLARRRRTSSLKCISLATSPGFARSGFCLLTRSTACPSTSKAEKRIEAACNSLASRWLLYTSVLCGNFIAPAELSVDLLCRSLMMSWECREGSAGVSAPHAEDSLPLHATWTLHSAGALAAVTNGSEFNDLCYKGFLLSDDEHARQDIPGDANMASGGSRCPSAMQSPAFPLLWHAHKGFYEWSF